MNIENSIKKIITITFLSIIIILGTFLMSYAGDYDDGNKYLVDKFKKGSSLYIDWEDAGLQSSSAKSNIFCVQKGYKLKNVPEDYKPKYEAKAVIEITGNDAKEQIAKDKSLSVNGRKANGKLAYAIHYNKGKAHKANVIWYLMPKWMAAVGNDFPDLNGYAVTQGDLKKKDLDENELDIISDAKSYAKNIDDGGNEKAEIKKKDTATVMSTVIEGEYYKIGPIKLEFTPAISSITLKDKSGSAVEDEDYYIVQGDYTYRNGIDDAIGQEWPVETLESGKEFYLYCKNTIECKSLVVRTKKTKGETIDAKIVFLEPTSKSKEDWQNLIIVKTTPKGTPGKSEKVTIEIPEPKKGSIVIKKIDADTQQPCIQDGFGFKLYNVDKGKYVKWSSTGTVEYVDSIEEAGDVSTGTALPHTTLSQYGNSTGIIGGLDFGTYKAIEVYNPLSNSGYEDNNPEKTVQVSSTNQNVTFVKENKQKYLIIKGKVWVDRTSGKNGVRNSLYNDGEFDDNDQLLNGIEVVAWDIKPTNPDEHKLYTAFTGANGKDGEYELKVPTDRLERIYIDLYYNALDYATVPAITWERYGVAGQIEAPEGKENGQFILDGNGNKILRKNSSKAFEAGERRERINNVYFNSIEKGEESQNGITDRTTGITKDEYGNQKGTLKYDLNNNVAKLTNISSLNPLLVDEETKAVIENEDMTRLWATIGVLGIENYRI